MTRKTLFLLLTVFTLVGSLSCENPGQVFTKSNHNYSNNEGAVVKYTGFSRSFTDTVQQHETDPYTQLKAAHGLQVDWVADAEQQVIVLGAHDQAGEVRVEVEDSMLKIRPADPMFRAGEFVRNLKVEVHGPAPQLIVARKFATLTLQDTLYREALTARARQHARLTGAIDTRNLSAEANTHSRLTLKGTLSSARIEATEHSDIELRGFDGKGQLQLKAGTFSAVKLGGQAQRLKGELTDHSHLKGRSFQAENSTLNLTSFSSGYVGVKQNLWLDCQAHSELVVTGAPDVRKEQVSQFGRLQIKGKHFPNP